MSSQFSKQNGKPKRFSIDDAFEEETDEAIKVYGATSPTLSNFKFGQGDSISITVPNGGDYKTVADASRDSDSLIQDYYDCSTNDEFTHKSCFRHPKVRENWRMVLAATSLLIIGLGLLITGILTIIEPNSTLQATVFLITGLICFIPGAYHVVYIYMAAKGKRGYHFHNLPLFT